MFSPVSYNTFNDLLYYVYLFELFCICDRNIKNGNFSKVFARIIIIHIYKRLYCNLTQNWHINHTLLAFNVWHYY